MAKKRSFWTRGRLTLAVVLLGMALRLWAAWQLPFDFDEPVYLEAAFGYARALQVGDLEAIIDYPENREHPPLVKLLYGATILGLGSDTSWEEALFAARLVSVTFGVLAVLLLALVDPLAGGLFAVQTVVVKYTGQAYLESVPLFFSLAAVFSLWRSRRAGDFWVWLSALSLGLVAAGKFSYFPILFVVLYLYLAEKRYPIGGLLVYMGLAGLVFLAFNPVLWRDPVNRLQEAVFFHARYSQGEDVLRANYPWYQPLLWVSQSVPYSWHPEVFFYYGFDGLIFFLALGGLRYEWRSRRWVVIWIATGMAFLLLWPTKWPQYSLVVLPAFCLAAGSALPPLYRWIKEQEDYWSWFSTMIPAPGRVLKLLVAGFLVVLITSALINAIFIHMSRAGWSHLFQGITPLPSNSVRDIASLADGRLVLATDHGVALYRLPEVSEEFGEWQVFTAENSGLPDNRVLSTAQDSNGGLWFGTRRGLARLQQGAWATYRPGEYGLPAQQVRELVFDPSGGLWIGTEAGLAYFNGTGWQAFTRANSELLSDFILALALEPGSNGERVWIGTQQGISVYDRARDEWFSYTSENAGLVSESVSDLMFDSRGRLWAATLGGGVSVLEAGAWHHYRVANSDLPFNTVQALYEDETGKIWIASSVPNNAGGLVANFDGEDWQVFAPNRSGYSGAETLVIAPDTLGRIWFGTATAGVDIYDPKN